MIIKFKRKQNINQILYYAAVLIFLINRLINLSLFSNYIPNIVNDFAFFLILIITAISFYGRRKRKTKILIIVTSLILMAMLLYIKSKLSILMVILFIIITAYKYDLIGIFKFQLFIIVFGTLLIVLSSLLGIIPNQIFDRNGVNVKAFGFFNYATIPYLIFAVNILFLYLNKLNRQKISIIILVDIITFSLFQNRLMFIIEILYFIFRYVLIKIDLYKLRKIFISFPWLMCFFTYLLSKKYDETNSLMYHINSLLSGRLYYNFNALESFDIQLFGKYIFMRGNLPIGAHSNLPYFYIDSGYIFSLISYGLIFTIIIMLMYSIIIKYAIDTKNVSLLTTILIICIANIINNVWVSLLYCPFILLFMEALQYEFMHPIGSIKFQKSRSLLCIKWE